MTLFDIRAELHEFKNIWCIGFEMGNWYVLASVGHYSLELTFLFGKI